MEAMARDLCDTYYLTVDPDRPMVDAYDKITEATRDHWRAQADVLLAKGWTKVSVRETVRSARHESHIGCDHEYGVCVQTSGRKEQA